MNWFHSREANRNGKEKKTYLGTEDPSEEVEEKEEGN